MAWADLRCLSLARAMREPVCGISRCRDSHVFPYFRNNIIKTSPLGRSGRGYRLSHRMKTRDLLVIVATAIIVMTICSTSSPLYQFNHWDDPNAFFTVGKSMLHGLVPYHDLFEHKGPLLYMLHAAAALVSFRSFLGVYLIEIIAATVFLYWGYKTMKILDENASILLIPVIGTLVYSTSSFEKGNSVEELMLPFYAFVIYVGLKSIREETRVSAGECVWVGISAAFALWMKFSLLGIFIGWYLFMSFSSFRRGDKVDILRMLGWLMVGILIPTVPILIFFAANNALTDLYDVYFYDNIFSYTRTTTKTHLLIVAIVRNLLSGVKNMLKYSFLFSVLLCASIVVLYRSKKLTYLTYLITTIGFTFLLVYVGGRAFRYYSFIMLSFMPMILVFDTDALKSLICNHYATTALPIAYKSVIVFLCCVAYLVCISPNTAYIGMKKNDYPPYVFANIVDKKPNATLLEYGIMDRGFYTTTGIVPSCKYFFRPNVCQDMIAKEQKEYVDKGLVDFVVTVYGGLISERYECIAQATFKMSPFHWWNISKVIRDMVRHVRNKPNEDADIHYCLYKLKED